MASTSERVVLITGAAGGLGRGLLEAFAREGWRVAAGWHRTPLPAAVPPGQGAANPAVESSPPPESRGSRDPGDGLPGPVQVGPVWPVRLDVTEPTQVRRAVADVLARWGRIDALVNNAGVTADQGLPQLREADWDHVLDVNLKGAFRCSQAVLRPMLRQREGHILNLGSFAGRVGARGQSAYAAAKAGLMGLTVALAREVGPRNVRVNAVLPGVLPTPLTAGLPPDALARFAAANALCRLNTLDEVARFVVFLAGMQNVSGQLFQLDSRIAPGM